jgi:RES domain-containing protein
MTGAGAHKFGGRWNSPGRQVVYASGNLTLAMLELLVHVDDAEAFRALAHVYHEIVFPRGAVAVLEEGNLPRGWNARPATPASQVVGDEWLERQESPILAVPSVIVPPEVRYDPLYMTYLVNPNHPEFKSAVSVGDIHELTWDVRLTR